MPTPIEVIQERLQRMIATEGEALVESLSNDPVGLRILAEHAPSDYLPLVLLRALARDPSFALAAARNPNWSASELEAVAGGIVAALSEDTVPEVALMTAALESLDALHRGLPRSIGILIRDLSDDGSRPYGYMAGIRLIHSDFGTAFWVGATDTLFPVDFMPVMLGHPAMTDTAWQALVQTAFHGGMLAENLAGARPDIARQPAWQEAFGAMEPGSAPLRVLALGLQHGSRPHFTRMLARLAERYPIEAVTLLDFTGVRAGLAGGGTDLMPLALSGVPALREAAILAHGGPPSR